MTLSTTTGFRLLPGRLSPQAQSELLAQVLARHGLIADVREALEYFAEAK